MKMIIGSTALKYWYKDFPRIPKDLDYAVYDSSIFPKEKGVEYLNNPILIENFKEYSNYTYIYPDILYTLKISHVIGWKLENNSWDRHLWDLLWLKSKGCILNRSLFDKLYKYWETIHGPNKRSDLNMSAEDFFDNAVDFPISHDYCHELLIQHPYFEGQKEPTYKKILKNGAEVDVCMEKFAKLTEKEKENVVMEEVMVMAMERYQKLGYLRAFHIMLKKFVREHAKIDEAIWILENWVKLHKAKFNFVEFLNEKIKETCQKQQQLIIQ